jgi:hypothetical protein
MIENPLEQTLHQLLRLPISSSYAVGLPEAVESAHLGLLSATRLDTLVPLLGKVRTVGFGSTIREE